MNNFKLEKKTVFITGGAKRIGAEIALFFAKNGANVCIHYNNSFKEAESLKQKIVSFGVKCEIYKANLTETSEALKAFSNAILDFGKVDFLINNASIFEKNTILNLKEEDFERDFKIQLKTPLFLMQAFAKQNFTTEEGFILNILDKNIFRKNTSFVSYLLSKKSLSELNQIAAFEFAPHVRVNSISLGFILEESFIAKNEILEYTEKKLTSIPLKKRGQIEDVLIAIEFLIRSTYITGENIIIDGGSFLNN